MNWMQISGLVLIGACIIAILTAVVIGDQIGYFIAAIVMGIAGNILWWLGKPRYAEDEEEPEECQAKEDGANGQASDRLRRFTPLWYITTSPGFAEGSHSGLVRAPAKRLPRVTGVGSSNLPPSASFPFPPHFPQILNPKHQTLNKLKIPNFKIKTHPALFAFQEQPLSQSYSMPYSVQLSTALLSTLFFLPRY